MAVKSTENPTRGLALSGGGYRATLFAVGSLWRLNELGLLKKLNRITSVSGGSIASGYLALNWGKLTFDNKDVATNFDLVIAQPLQDFCSKDLDINAVITGLLNPFQTIGDKIALAYDARLFANAPLTSIPAGDGIPEFIFYATNYDTGASVRITRDKIYDYKIGEASSSSISLAQAVAASSAFPPFFSPIILNSSRWTWTTTKFVKLPQPKLNELRHQLTLVDGGLYDNMGMEAIWKTDPQSEDHFDQVFVCDAGAPLEIGYGNKSGAINWILEKTGLNRNWGSQLMRMSDVMIDQQRALRKRQLIDNFKSKQYGGSYWGITTEIINYGSFPKVASDSNDTARLKDIPTRLTAFSARDQGQLINWGYALTDAAIRAHVDPSAPIGSQPITQFKLP